MQNTKLFSHVICFKATVNNILKLFVNSRIMFELL